MVTAQNTKGVETVTNLAPEIIRAQIDAVASDFTVLATKTGFLGTAEAVEAVSARIAHWQLPNLVVDPVLVATDGRQIVSPETLEAYRGLFAGARLVTPNSRELALLTGRQVADAASLVAATRAFSDATGCATLATGGHLDTGADVIDVLTTPTGTRVFTSSRITSNHVHGTGCSLASAIAARLAAGSDLERAVEGAQRWVRVSIQGAVRWELGSGQGPIDHFGWAAAPNPAPP